MIQNTHRKIVKQFLSKFQRGLTQIINLTDNKHRAQINQIILNIERLMNKEFFELQFLITLLLKL